MGYLFFIPKIFLNLDMNEVNSSKESDDIVSYRFRVLLYAISMASSELVG